MSGIREQLLKLGWCQGSIIEADAIAYEVLAVHVEADAFLILNQTCDLINDSWDKEPVVELLPLARIAKANTGMLNGRNPRQIHFEVIVGAAACLVEAFAPKAVTLPRDLLLKAKPSTNWSLDGPVLKSLLAWRAARYLRTAFPDAFEYRLKPVFKDRHSQCQQLLRERLGQWLVRTARGGRTRKTRFPRLPADRPCACGSRHRAWHEQTRRAGVIWTQG